MDAPLYFAGAREKIKTLEHKNKQDCTFLKKNLATSMPTILCCFLKINIEYEEHVNIYQAIYTYLFILTLISSWQVSFMIYSGTIIHNGLSNPGTQKNLMTLSFKKFIQNIISQVFLI